MTMRLFSPIELRANAELILGDEQARYVGRVLRLKKGDALRVFDGNGGEYCAIILSVTRKELRLSVGEHVKQDVESPLRLRLVQGISKGERMDIVVQKATELGVHRISPMLTDYSVVKLSEDRAETRRLHWQKVAQSACEQCRRNVVPQVDMPQNLTDWFAEHAGSPHPKLMLDGDAYDDLSAVQLAGQDVSILVGPEGGFSDAEHERAAAAGVLAVRLGPRTLRTETAALAALCIAQATWGDFRSK